MNFSEKCTFFEIFSRKIGLFDIFFVSLQAEL